MIGRHAVRVPLDSATAIGHPAAMSAIQMLRERTAANHDAVDAAFARFDLTERSSYAAALVAHARALGAVEPMLAAHGLMTRARLPLLVADLADLGRPMPTSDRFELEAAGAWGAFYVAEGSRLGGVMLARSVGAGLPKRYLADGHLPGEWRGIRQAIDAAGAAGGPGWVDRAVAGAQATFDRYLAAAAD